MKREDPLKCSCKSTRDLESELQKQGYEISHATVGSLLSEIGYILQANRKTREGMSHKDSDAQFLYKMKALLVCA